jgi:hypothetical protein
VAGHALVGCAASAAGGGDCGTGALSGAVAGAAAPAIMSLHLGFAAELTAESVLGGVAAVAGGGKFANGAITGAFGYLFNSQGGRIAGEVIGTVVGATVGGGPEDLPADALGGLIGGAVGDAITGGDATPAAATTETYYRTMSQQDYQTLLALAKSLRPGKP